MGTERGTTEVLPASPTSAEDAATESQRVPAPASSAAPAADGAGAAYAVLGHDVLFRDDDDTADRCDVCGAIVAEDAGEGPAVPGRALYVWTRGDEVRRDEPPLCPACAAALGLTALARWEIEEEEG